MTNIFCHLLAIDTDVAYKDRKKWIVHYLQFRISRGQKHIDAIRQGINDVIPLEILDTFSAEELQRWWCADIADLDVEDWKNHIHVEYGVSPKVIQYFYRYLDEATDERRRDVS